tara:strand:- start:1411 stop:1548 length:138 start_codon:yes stop_codon:yes gene_type:complete
LPVLVVIGDIFAGIRRRTRIFVGASRNDMSFLEIFSSVTKLPKEN